MADHPHPLVRVHTFGNYKVTPDGPLPDGRDIGPNGEEGWAQEWIVEADIREGGSVLPRRSCRFSASLTCALNEGTFSHPWERPIPASVLEKLDKLADKLAGAGLY